MGREATATSVETTGLRAETASEEGALSFLFHCADELSFVARIEAGKVWLFLPEESVDLPRLPSGSGDGELILILSQGPCQDTMTDARFKTRVSIELTGNTYQGCGMALH